MISTLACIIVAFIYFFPTLIAVLRGGDGVVITFAINLIFGWMVLGWLIALVIALSSPAPKLN